MLWQTRSFCQSALQVLALRAVCLLAVTLPQGPQGQLESLAQQVAVVSGSVEALRGLSLCPSALATFSFAFSAPLVTLGPLAGSHIGPATQSFLRSAAHVEERHFTLEYG